MKLSHQAATLLAVAVAALAQDPVKPAITRNTDVASITARKARLSVQFANAAAAAQLASIRNALHTMLTGVLLDASTDAADLAGFGEDELLKIFAQQLEQFLQQFKGTSEAEAARALLARIYLALGSKEDALRVLKDFDADRAAKSDLLQLVMSMGTVPELFAKAEQWLREVGLEAPVWQDRFDAIFVAARLGKWELAAQVLTDVQAAARSPADKAAVLVAAADMVARLGITATIPVNDPGKRGKFLVDALTAAKLDANEVPVGSWRAIKSAPVDASHAARQQAIADAKRLDDALKNSDLYQKIVLDAAAGLRLMKALQPVDAAIKIKVDDRFVPAGDRTMPVWMPPVELVVDALRVLAVHRYPGTPAAKQAAVALAADALQQGAKAPSFRARKVDGTPISSADLIGKIVILDFCSIHDGDCLADRKVLAKLHRDYAAMGLEIVTIAMDGNPDSPLWVMAADEFGMKWPIVFDGKGPHTDVAVQFGVQNVPARLVIGPDGDVWEDRAWKLSPDEIELTIRAALGMQRKALSKVDAAFLVEDRYYGPAVDARIQRGKDGKLVVDAAVWVADSGYQLKVGKVENKPDAVKVYLDLELQAWQSDADRVLRRVQAPLPDAMAGAKLVKVYVQHKMASVAPHEETQHEPELADVIEFDPATIGYTGPRIDIQLFSTDGIPPEYTAVLTASLLSSAYTMEVEQVTHEDSVSRIMVRIAPAQKRAADEGGKGLLQIAVPLGVNVGSMVEVLVAEYNREAGEARSYTLANRVARRF